MNICLGLTDSKTGLGQCRHCVSCRQAALLVTFISHAAMQTFNFSPSSATLQIISTHRNDIHIFSYALAILDVSSRLHVGYTKQLSAMNV